MRICLFLCFHLDLHIRSFRTINNLGTTSILFPFMSPILPLTLIPLPSYHLKLRSFTKCRKIILLLYFMCPHEIAFYLTVILTSSPIHFLSNFPIWLFPSLFYLAQRNFMRNTHLKIYEICVYAFC